MIILKVLSIKHRLDIIQRRSKFLLSTNIITSNSFILWLLQLLISIVFVFDEVDDFGKHFIEIECKGDDGE